MYSLCNLDTCRREKAMIRVFVLLLSVLAHPSAGLECLHCEGVLDTGHCDTFTTCGDHEVCYVDNFELPDGQQRFDLGCRKQEFCPVGQESLVLLGQWLQHGLGNRSVTHGTETLLCSECCLETLCNTKGCGEQGMLNVHDGNRFICAKCDQHNSTNDCNKFTLCNTNQVCRLDRVANSWSSNGHYVSGCEDTKECIYKMNMYEHSYGHTDRNCDIVCCNSHLCNTKCNETFSWNTTQTLMTSYKPTQNLMTSHKTTQNLMTTQTTTADPCGINPCIHGHCTVNNGSYICTCLNGYRGQHCEYHCRYLRYTTMYYDLHHQHVNYAIVKHMMTYSQGEQYCEAHCGQLLQVYTSEKLHFFKQFLSHIHDMAHTYWINGQLNTDNEWKTSTGHSLSSDLWARDPSRHMDSKCASIEDDADYKLVNYNCHNHHYIICEKL